jgi:hypothetical protein
MEEQHSDRTLQQNCVPTTSGSVLKGLWKLKKSPPLSHRKDQNPKKVTTTIKGENTNKYNIRIPFLFPFVLNCASIFVVVFFLFKKKTKTAGYEFFFLNEKKEKIN